MRDHLHGGAEIVAAPLLADDLLIDAAGGDVVGLRGRDAGEALVMAEIEIGLGAVVGDEDLAVLIGAHGPRIDIEIGVELAQTHLKPRACSSAPSAADARPLPSEETTPPVMKMYRAMGLDPTPKRPES